MRALLREPALHFLLIGAALFALYRAVAPAEPRGERIVVSRAVIDNLAREHQARWHRAPDAQELEQLVEAWIHDEILYREGVALGLDRDDPVIKRRVRQKLEVMAEEQRSRDAPTEAQLAATLARHAGRFELPAQVSFEQILLGPQAGARQVEALRAEAERGTDPARLGPPTLLPAHAQLAALDRIARDFGAGFAAQLEQLPLGVWSGPVPSAFGQHLVRVGARTPRAVQPLHEVRNAVAREWENERRTEALAASYQALRSRYDVAIEAGEPGAAARR